MNESQRSIDLSLCFQGPQQVSLRKLSTGATFGGDAIVFEIPRDATVVTQAGCELLRVEQHDFKTLWEVSTCIATSTNQIM